MSSHVISAIYRRWRKQITTESVWSLRDIVASLRPYICFVFFFLVPTTTTSGNVQVRNTSNVEVNIRNKSRKMHISILLLVCYDFMIFNLWLGSNKTIRRYELNWTRIVATAAVVVVVTIVVATAVAVYSKFTLCAMCIWATSNSCKIVRYHENISKSVQP